MPGFDGRESVITGKGAIVLRVQNGYTFHEHHTVESAKTEAERLASGVGGDFIVYVPVAIVRPAPRTVTEVVQVRDLPAYLADNDPFVRKPVEGF
jgi:hypothetical protein